MMQSTHIYERTPLNKSSSKGFLKQGKSKWIILWRGLNVVMCIFFILCAIVQLNDPDSYVWIPIYVVPSMLSLMIVVKPDITDVPVWKHICGLFIAVYIAGSLYLIAMVFKVLAGRVKNPLEHEEGRELAGVVIVIAWLCVCRFSTFGRNMISSCVKALRKRKQVIFSINTGRAKREESDWLISTLADDSV